MYADLQELFSDKQGLVFSNRFDEFIAISNKITLKNHKEIYEEISKNKEQINLSISIGIEETPLKSVRQAHFVKDKKDFLNFPHIYGNTYEMYEIDKNDHKEIKINNANENENNIKVLHMDIDSSSKIMKDLSAYEITNKILRLYSKISDIFIDEESLTFFLGGDNFMIISKKDISTDKIINIINTLTKTTGIRLNCGIGYGDTGRKAAKMATKSLDLIRDFRKQGKIINVYESN